MTDEEMVGWLSEEEQICTWAASVMVKDIVRSLAETRKALWRLADTETIRRGYCACCGATTHHHPDCACATMPRPRKP